MADHLSASDVFALEHAMRATVPEVIFAPPRIVRAVARRHRDEPLGLGRLPHRDVVVLPARRLVELAADLLVPPADLPDLVAVVARPTDDRADGDGGGEVAGAYWRRTFHALLDLAAPRVVMDHGADLAAAIGAESLAEARDVLIREGLVDLDASDDKVLAEFIAVVLERSRLDPASLAAWFPAIEHPEPLVARLEAAIGADALAARARPAGIELATDLVPRPDRAMPERSDRPWWTMPWPRPRASVLRRRADRTAPTGNTVRAAIDEWRAMTARPETARPAPGRLARQVDTLARRLAWALDLDPATCDAAAEFIRGLVASTRGSTWSPEARLLYDLQKICVDSERESFRTQLLPWLLTAGRRPLAIPLPCQRLVLIHRHATAALQRLPSVDVPDDVRAAGDRVLEEAVATTDAAARESLRPRLERCLAEAGLAPQTLVEEAAREKLVDELLDAIMDRGFVSFGSVRDAISRNQVKLRDLGTAADWVHGDELLRLDARLAATLDGVYRPAPAYLAVMQRLSAPFFGTGIGRLVTTHVLLPLGGAWIALRGIEHLVEPVTEYSLGEPWHVYTRGRMLAIAALAWALLHLPPVRQAAWQGVRASAALIRLLAVVLPSWLLRLPAVAWALRSPPVRWFVDHALSPLLVTVAAWLLLPHHGGWIDRGTRWFPPVVFAVAAAALNSPAGRQFQDQAVETTGRLLRQFHAHVIVGLISWIVDAFRRALDVVEGTLYAVDESLRFRTDESGLTLAVKAVLGAVWSVIEACVRFCVTLLIEPQLNPIKHFPVVTVSHKLLVPMIPVVASQLVATTGMERGLALTATTFVSTAIPGVFGFLAWELKENWRLYAANRPATLRPSVVGHHGETMRRLLLPGFHSGTLPRLFARLRGHGSPAARLRALRTLEELRHDVAAFVNRDLLALVERTAAGRGLGLSVGDVRLSCVRIRVEVDAGTDLDHPLVLDVIRDGDTIVVDVPLPGWLATLDGDRLRVMRLALAGFCRLADADAAGANWIDLPDAGSPAAGRRLTTPLAWTAWQDAWQRLA
ncbi:MAG: hypothetical protein ACKO40_16040 [Planctomycetaceae bacterium]